MILKKLVAIIGVLGLLMGLVLKTAEAENCASTLSAHDVPNFAINFTASPGSINDYAVNNPMMVFFRVPDDATSTSSSMSYNNFARLAPFAGISIGQLQAATSGMEIEGINYVIIDLTALGPLASGGLKLTSSKIAGAAANAEKLTVLEAYTLDNEFTIIALNAAHQGTPTAFSKSPTWTKAATLNIKFTSSVYQS